MRKCLVMLGLLSPFIAIGILVGQNAPQRAPEQGIAKSGSGQNGRQQPNLQNGDHQADPPAVTGQPSTPAGEAAKEEARQNLKIQGELALFTGLLVFVGLLQAGTMIWQAWLLKDTKEKIQVQAGHMEDQSKTLRESVAAAQKSAGAAETSAKAAMGVAVPTLVVSRFSFVNEGRESREAFFQYPRIKLELRNYGQSPAFLRRYAIGFSWDDKETGKPRSFPFEDQVIAAGDTYPLNEIDLGVLEYPPEAVVKDLIAGTRHLTAAGWVSYGDLFDSPVRKLTFCRELIEYDPDPAQMIFMDTSILYASIDTAED